MSALVDPEKLPAMFPVLTASRVLGIGKNATYDLVKAGEYPIRVRKINGRLKCSRYDLLAFLGAPGYSGDRGTVTELRPVRSAS